MKSNKIDKFYSIIYWIIKWVIYNGAIEKIPTGRYWAYRGRSKVLALIGEVHDKE